jgi:hypothetical protein
LLWVYHYSVNVPYADDWDMIPLVVAAIHGHLTMGALWSQYVAGRPFVTRLIVVAFGALDHLNEKAIILFSAFTFIASFVLMLLSFRSYLGKRLTVLPVLSIGLVWFSFADLWNALFALQLVVFLVVFFFTAMAWVLLVPQHHRHFFFVLGILAAVAASCSFLQGFVVWPVGLICLLWVTPWNRRTYYESAIWLLAAGATAGIYLHGYSFADNTCVAEGGQPGACTLRFALLHPVYLIRYFVVVVGNVVPTSVYSIQPRYVVVYELLGVAISILAAFVVVQTVRERRQRANPLPLVLITFALLFDLMITLGHLGEGLLTAGDTRFTLPNIILLVGIAVYAWAHIPNLRHIRGHVKWHDWLKIVGLGTLGALLAAQCVMTTRFGITNGSAFKTRNELTARVVVNLNRIPIAKQDCYLEGTVVGDPLDAYLWHSLALRNHLSVFQTSSRRLYRAEGPPAIEQCDQGLYVSTTSLPVGKIGVPYSARLTATGGDSAYVWSLGTGSSLLPKGLMLNAVTGVISGVPEMSGVNKFSVSVAPSQNTQSTPSCWACAAAAPPPPFVTYPRSLVITIS